ncbi:MAG TPA: R3H domain-containing nucleic acid-binding protein [Candidatus Polarisedimenticolia bacterium]|nr:R3H domain-containing nucleic acid-binding protein [Candidatus Polarisedimenticolia bacterium]
MSEERSPAPKRPHNPAKERFQPEPPLDRERATEELKRFLDLILREMHLALDYEISSPDGAGARPEETSLAITFRGADEDLLLERNAELLLALEHLAHRWLRLHPRLHDRVRFDCGDYRAVRLEELKLSARVAAQRVRETGQPHRFNPMSSRERRIIHLELTGAPGVRTVSEGMGDRRQLVIYPATTKK